MAFGSAAPAAALLLMLAVAAGAAAAATGRGPHITDLDVLLPPRMTNPVQFRLQGTDGCFTWSWDHHDILNVQPEYNSSSRCSTSARLVSISRYSGRKETAVYATDLRSGITIRCKVSIDMISRIQIFHHATKIDLDELATLRIRAFDAEENVFSSLVGLPFLWKLGPESSEDDVINHLIHVPLKETPLSDCGGFCGDLDTQTELEDKGLGSDLYVVKGVTIGHEVVRAQLLEDQLEHVTDKITLTVAEAMSLYPPSPVFITIGAQLQYSLRVMRLKTAQVINLPSPHHQWLVQNSSVAWVETAGIVHGVKLGNTNVIVEDIRVPGHVQTSSVHVVVPDKMRLYILPLINKSIPLDGTKPASLLATWYIFPGQEYIVFARLFTEDEMQILITENNSLRLDSSTSEYWDLHSSVEAAATYDLQDYRLLKPLSPGLGVLTASITYQREYMSIPEVLSINQEVRVCSKVKLSFLEEYDYFSEQIHLPWAPGVNQEVQLKATGGCGKSLEDYKWFSSDKAVVLISDSGTAQANKPGQAIIKVVSAFDFMNYDEVLIEVSIPSSMAMLPFPVEVVRGTEVQASISLKTTNGNFFSKCDAFRSFVRWQVSSERGSFQITDTNTDARAVDIFPRTGESKILYINPCAWTSLLALDVGQAILHASLSLEPIFSQSIDGPIVLKASSPIAAYYPLKVYQAEDGNHFGGYSVDLPKINDDLQDLESKALDELYLVPGSSMDLLLLGGPERWNRRVDFIESVDVLSDDSSVDVGVVRHYESSSTRKFYRVVCQRYSKFKLLFSRGNLAGDDHPMRAVENVELPVTCSFPSSITLIVNEPANTLDAIRVASDAYRTSERLRSPPVTVSNGCTIRLSAVGIHSTGRAFANSSSLCLRWKLDGCEELAFWNDSSQEELHNALTWERFLVLQNVSGLCTVRATVIGFLGSIAKHVFGDVRSMLEGAASNLTDAVSLQLVSSLRLLPESTLLLYHPEAKVNLSVNGGTCSLDASVNDTNVVQMIENPKVKKCSHLTVGARGLGVATVIVRDVGLSPPSVASALVQVSNVEWIKIVSQEEISLVEGSVRTFDVLAGINDGRNFESAQYKYMGIKVHIEDDILEIEDNDCSPRNGFSVVCEPTFTVKAVKVGVTTLYVSHSQLSGDEISSQLVKVEVFRPLLIYPEYIYLAPGASFALSAKYGPSIGVFVEYTSLHEGIAIVQKSSGKIFANSRGNATVRAAVYGNGGTLICEAYGIVEVGIPPAMILDGQSDRLCIGCELPIFPSIPKGDLFSFYEVCQDYKWTVANEKVLSFQIIKFLHAINYEEKDIQYSLYDNNNTYVNVLSGRSAGETEVSVLVSCSFVISGVPEHVFYSASKFVEVVPNPPLALGIPMTWVLPPFYTSTELLPRLPSPFGQLDSHNRKQINYSLLRACGRNDIVKKESITIDGAKIRTSDANNLGCLLANDQSTRRMEIACCIRVAEVAQVRIKAAETPILVASLPVNAKLELIASYYDDLGYEFLEANGAVPLYIETNRPDILSVSKIKRKNGADFHNESIMLQAKSTGNALLRISINDDQKKAGFILVSVGAHLYPRNPILNVGQHLNFTVIGDDIEEFKSGKWFSGNRSVLSLNEMTGEGYAHGEGETQVTFEATNIKLRTEVTVMKLDQIIVDAPIETLSNVPFPTKGYKFSVKFSGPFSDKFKAIGIHNKIPYDCQVDPPSIGYAKPWIDFASGDFYCVLFPYSPMHFLSDIPKSNRKMEESCSDGFLYISVTASVKETPPVSGSAHAPFVGGFAVAETEKLILTPNSSKSIIQIIGNTDVKISWKSKDLLAISLLNSLGSGIAGIRDYEVKVLKEEEFEDNITIILPTTGQKVEIGVSYRLHKGPAASGTVISWLAVVICGILLILTVIVFKMLLNRPDRSPPPRQARPSSSTPGLSPMTTDRPSMASNQSTPRTPQPVMDYVRRTIDETPYYKRDRRRFDPQYTY